MAQESRVGTYAAIGLIAVLAFLNVFQYMVSRPLVDSRPGPGTPGRSPDLGPLPPQGPTTFEDGIATPVPSTGEKIDPADERKVIDRFHEIAYDHQFGFFSRGLDFRQAAGDYVPSRWLGIITQQNPNDAWVTQEIIAEQKPDFIVETGTLLGGGALLWATFLEQVNPKGKVLTIDIEDRVTDAKDVPLFGRMVETLVGSSTDPAIVAKVKGRVEGKKILFILDSDHSKKHVLEELKLYAPMVEVGGYVLVQDSNTNGHPVVKTFGPGPYEAIEEFLASDDRFVADRSRERFLFSMHPKGFLKRVK